VRAVPAEDDARNLRLEDLAEVGPGSARLLNDLGIARPRDVLEYLPFRYEDLRFPTPSSRLGEGTVEDQALGTVVWLRERRVRDLEIVEARLRDDDGLFVAKWIGRNRYVIGRFREGMRLFVRGRVERTPLGGAVVNVAQYRILAEGEPYRGEVIPIYRGSKELPTRKIRRIVSRNLPRLLSLVGDDPLPEYLAHREGYPPSLREAYRAVHAPRTLEEAERARERFVFTEFLALAAAAELRRLARERDHTAEGLAVPGGLLAEFEASLPFALTASQRRAIEEIWNDMCRDVPMNRLLQGDVGSGKTIVAAAAILLCARNGAQSVLMAPTEVLAAQHARKLAPLLLPFGIGVEALFGSLSQRARREALERIASGQAALAVGTHALLTDDVTFARLGLVVIDEQHRFGVEQRARLRAKGGSPHTLSMTATPIPRTLAQTIHADLDLTVLNEMPPGRTPVETFAIRSQRAAAAYDLIRMEVAAGRQAYVVAPAVDDESELANVTAEAERLRTGPLAGLRIGVLHGKLPTREKDAIMGAFAQGRLDVLVATTVIEVGVDVPNATVMVVLDAHRYGLAQLHQLRGRVGRGADRSWCVLVYPDDGEETRRLEVLTRTTDGFLIADEDLKIRGPGDLTGTDQSGRSPLRFGDLSRDIEIYRRAQAAARTMLSRDPRLQDPEHRGLRELLEGQPSLRALLLSS